MPSPENLLLARLPIKDRARLLKSCEHIVLTLDDVLSAPDDALPHVYFPTDGFISLVTRMDGKPVLEIGMVGTEGMLGAQLALGPVADHALHPVVQGRGHAWRMTGAAFQAHVARSPALRSIVHAYLQVTLGQMATSAACLRFHRMEPRLARWLLMTQDRAHSKTFEMTHEFLAFMLGMRRVGITTAAASLKRRGFISYRRGVITVISRRGLLSCACSCYAANKRIHQSLLSTAITSSV